MKNYLNSMLCYAILNWSCATVNFPDCYFWYGEQDSVKKKKR